MKFVPNGTGKFRFWCQKVLPLVYDDSLSYYEVLCKLVTFVNNLAERIADAFDEINLSVKEYVEQWLTDHPEATTTVMDGAITYAKLNGELTGNNTPYTRPYINADGDNLEWDCLFVTPDMFGAVGDGVNNDYDAFSACASYANTNHTAIFVPNKSYYINGNNPIELRCNVVCDNSTFLVGENHITEQNPVFIYSHDSEVAEINGNLVDFFSDNYTVTNSLVDKFFVLDTGIAYGTAVSASAPSTETIKETCVCNNNKTHLYFVDDITSNLTKAVKVTNVSDADEIGYTFKGAVIKQKSEELNGTYFLKVRRHNCTIRDIQIDANTDFGGGSIIYAQFCNNLTIDNIRSYSKQPENRWTYEISMYYCSNVLINNLKGFNLWSTVASRGLKNYTLTNSVTNTFDCHWNAYGSFLCENCQLYESAHVGYGRGSFTVRNVTCDNIKPRTDYVQIWEGNINVEDVETVTGVWVNLSEDNATGFDSFFNALKLPTIRMKNVKGETRNIFIRVPDGSNTRFTTRGYLYVDGTLKPSSPYEVILYNAIITGAPLVDNNRAVLQKACEILSDDNYRFVEDMTSSYFSSLTARVQKKNGIVVIQFSGVANDNITARTVFAVLPNGFEPSNLFYAPAVNGVDCANVEILANGNLRSPQVIQGGERFSFCAVFATTAY